MKIELPEKKPISKELLPQIVERIFSICKNDENFHLKVKMTKIDDNVDSILNNDRKQDALLSQSKELSRNLLTRINNLRRVNQETRDRLLESLGSEL